MSSTKLKVGNNMFANLANSDDDSFDGEEEKDYEIKGPVLDPDSVLGQFVTASKNAKSALDIAKALDRVMKVGKTSRTYDNKFETYDSLSPTEYLSILEGRINCFNDRITDEVMDKAYDLWKSLVTSKTKNQQKIVNKLKKKIQKNQQPLNLMKMSHNSI